MEKKSDTFTGNVHMKIRDRRRFFPFCRKSPILISGWYRRHLSNWIMEWIARFPSSTSLLRWHPGWIILYKLCPSWTYHWPYTVYCALFSHGTCRQLKKKKKNLQKTNQNPLNLIYIILWPLQSDSIEIVNKQRQHFWRLFSIWLKSMFIPPLVALFDLVVVGVCHGCTPRAPLGDFFSYTHARLGLVGGLQRPP